MKIKGYIIVAALTAFVSWLVFSPDDEDSQRTKVDSDQEAGSELRTLPRTPEPLAPQDRHGLARLDAESPPREYAPRPYSLDQRWQQAPGYRPIQPPQDLRERFSFRPLSERERARMGADRPYDGYFPEMMAPPPSPRTYSQEPTAGEWYGQPPWGSGYPAWESPDPRSGEGYSFRRNSGRSGGVERWPRSYPDRARANRQSPESNVPWAEPTAPQWGSTPPDWTPPAQRMYPSLPAPLDRRFTAR